MTWRDIEERNTTMIARSFLKLCRYNHMIPGVFEIEKLEKFLAATLPPISIGEEKFYKENSLSKAYDADPNYQTTQVEPKLDSQGEKFEPELHFHEFVFLLNLIAYNCIDSRDSIKAKLSFFYEDKLKFKKLSEAQAHKDLSYDEVLMRT